MTQIGDRVGAMMSRTATTVDFCGYGVYVGDKPCPMLGYRANPKIQLDNGKQVWGCECWWGDEAEMQKEIAGLTVTDVSATLPAFDPNDGPPSDFGANCMIAINCVFAGREPTKAEAEALWNDLTPEQQNLATTIAPILCSMESSPAASGSVSP